MGKPILDYPSEPRPRPRRTGWRLWLLLALLTPFILYLILFALVVTLTALGFFGGPGD